MNSITKRSTALLIAAVSTSLLVSLGVAGCASYADLDRATTAATQAELDAYDAQQQAIEAQRQAARAQNNAREAEFSRFEAEQRAAKAERERSAAEDRAIISEYRRLHPYSGSTVERYEYSPGGSYKYRYEEIR